MLNKLITKLTIWALRKRLTGENRTEVMAVLLDNIGALPIRKLVARDSMGKLLINGRTVEDANQISAFHQSFMAYKDNPARKLIADQKKFLAIEMGVHQGLTTEQIQFSKACLWNIQQDEEIINEILAE